MVHFPVSISTRLFNTGNRHMTFLPKKSALANDQVMTMCNVHEVKMS